jgi:hypothetical protein
MKNENENENENENKNKKLQEYKFPYDTCEKKSFDTIVKQPYSTIIGVITCILIIIFIFLAKSLPTKMVFLSLLIFESLHTYSHFTHLPDNKQVHIVHYTSYLFTFSLLFWIVYQTKIYPSYGFILILVLLYSFDIYAFNCLPFIYYFISQIIIFVSILFAYYSFLPKSLKQNIPLIFLFTLLVIGFEVNEVFNCNRMLQFYPYFPYHILVETCGLIAFYFIAKSMYKL